jgi:hypothetical protein
MIGLYVMHDVYSAQRGISLGLIEKLVTFFGAIVFYDKIYKCKMVVVMNCFIVYLCFYFIFSGFVEISYRLSMLFVFSYWALWPGMMYVFKAKPARAFVLILILLYAILKMSLYRQPVQTYDNILLGGASNYAGRYELLQKGVSR